MIILDDQHKETILAALRVIRDSLGEPSVHFSVETQMQHQAEIDAAIEAIEAPASDASESWTPLSDGIYRDAINATGVVVKDDMLRTFNDFDEGVEVALSNNARLCIWQAQRTPAPALPGPSWEDAPDEVSWWTVDADGDIFYSVDEPQPDKWRCMWDRDDESDMLWRPKPNNIEIPIGVDWRTLKRQRPAAQE